MSGKPDQQYLLSEQYRDGSNLNARFQLHERFSTNKYGWHLWIFDQFNLSPKSRVLELGCGPGYLWSKNVHRIPEGWDIALSDFSPGMLGEAQSNLQDSQRAFRFEVIDAQSIPFKDEDFDAAIANHMLYHVPDRDQAFAEIHRVLKPGGRFYAATNGRAHLRELGELVRRFEPNLPEKHDTGVRTGGVFSLENGAEQLSRWFSEITLRRYKDGLVIPEVEPLVAWARSWAKPFFSEERLTEFFEFLERELALQGAIRVTKDSGIFEAQRLR